MCKSIFIIVLFLAHIYVKYRNLNTISDILYGLRPAVVALIGTAGISIMFLAFLGQRNLDINVSINYISIIFFAIGMYFLRRYKSNPIYVMLGCGVAGAIIYNI